MKPVLFVTGHAPAYRAGAFQRLHERESVELALFGGRLKHGVQPSGVQPSGVQPPGAQLPFPHRRVRERDVYGLACSGRYRAVVCSTGGRLAPLGAWAGARRARVPVILWASLWAHPRTVVHVLGFPVLRRLYRSADAVVAYGPHVRAYVERHGARNVHVAAQAVDNSFWGSPEIAPPASPAWPADAQVKFLFAGRAAREKGLGVLAEAWMRSGLRAPTAALVLVGVGPTPPWVPADGAVCPDAGAVCPDADAGRPDADAGAARPADADAMCPDADAMCPDTSAVRPADGAVCLEPVAAVELRNLYAAADVLVLPSIRTRTFCEPWGLVVNEAMNQGLAVIASDAVGAAAGGLVRDGRNGLVVPAGDSGALAAALARLAGERELRERMGRAGREDVQAYSYDAWAAGFCAALASAGVSSGRW